MTNFPIRRNHDLTLTPFTDLEALQREMNRLFDFSLSRPGYDDTSLLGGQWAPLVDIYDSKDNLVVKADLPGLSKDDIQVAIQENILTISGEKKQELNVSENEYLRTERFYGSFHRAITLPTEVDRTKVQANFKDGVLELILPKKEEAKPQQIKIDVK